MEHLRAWLACATAPQLYSYGASGLKPVNHKAPRGKILRDRWVDHSAATNIHGQMCRKSKTGRECFAVGLCGLKRTKPLAWEALRNKVYARLWNVMVDVGHGRIYTNDMLYELSDMPWDMLNEEYICDVMCHMCGARCYIA